MPFERPLCPAQALRQGWWSLGVVVVVAVVRVCGLGWAWVCVSVRPGFSMCRGGALGGRTRSCLFSLRRKAGKDTFLASAALLCCAVCCASKAAGTLGPAGAAAWCGVADGGGGGDLPSCMDGYGEGGALD